jgi:hypothetical protein
MGFARRRQSMLLRSVRRKNGSATILPAGPQAHAPVRTRKQKTINRSPRLSPKRTGSPETGGEYGANQARKNHVAARIECEHRAQLDLSAGYTLSNLPTRPQLTLNVVDITGEERRSNFWHDTWSTTTTIRSPRTWSAFAVRSDAAVLMKYPMQ